MDLTARQLRRLIPVHQCQWRKVGQETVNFAWDDGAGTLTATIATSTALSGRVELELFNVVVDQVTGAYTLTLVRNVLHATETAPGTMKIMPH